MDRTHEPWRTRARFAFALGATALLACSSGRPRGDAPSRRPGAERKTMALEIQAKLQPSEVVFQESPAIAFSLVNAGPAPLPVQHPGRVQNLPWVTLTDVRTGRAQNFQPPSESWITPQPQLLSPGAKIEWTTDLESLAHVPAPGEYDVALRYPYDEKRIATSNEMRLLVLPSTPHDPAVATVNGATGPMQSAVWVSATGKLPRLLRGTFSLLGANPELRQAQSLGSIPAGARPQLSAPANGQVSRDHWIAWLEGTTLKATHWGERHPIQSALALLLPWPDAQLVGPLFTEPLADPTTPPAGAALLWHGDRAGLELTEVKLGPQRLALGSTVRLAGVHPQWIRSFARSDGDRMVLTLAAEGDRIVLRWVSWRNPGGEHPHAEWTGRFIAAGATLDPDDHIRGAVLLEEAAAGRHELRLVQWELNVANEGSTLRQDAIVTDLPWPIEAAEVAVSSRSAAVLLRGRGGADVGLWQSGSGYHRLAHPPESNDLPLVPTFRNDFDVVLLEATRERGWEIVGPDGGPFPAAHEHGAESRSDAGSPP